MNRWVSCLCLLTLVGVLFGTGTAWSCSDDSFVVAADESLAAPCCPEGVPQEPEHSETNCSCPCDPGTATLTERLSPPVTQVAWLNPAPFATPPSHGNAPQHPVPIV